MWKEDEREETEENPSLQNASTSMNVMGSTTVNQMIDHTD